MRILVGMLIVAGALTAQERDQARSMVITKQGIVATSQTLASQVGAHILARGGSAVDAAIAANAVLGVVEPMMCGIGGDLFVIYREAKTGKLHGLNGSGRAGRGVSIAALRAKGLSAMPGGGIHAVTVPGAVRGWDDLHKKFGKLPWRDLFQPAIYYAKNGFPVTEIIQFDWDGGASKLMGDDNARRVYTKNGRAYRVGEIFFNPELAKAYEVLADAGAAAFYSGAIRDSILKTSKRLGGLLAAEDFAEHKSEWVEPISVDYRGWKVSEVPPNGQGIGVLMMLNLFERFNLPEMEHGSADAFHSKIEAQKLAYQDLTAYVGDPRFVKVPVEGMLNKRYAAERAKGVDNARANCDAGPGDPPKTSGNTIYLSVVDKEGNVASWIQSISDLWGSGVVVDDFGFHLHDRGGGFRFDEKHPNALAPGKRPFHTIIPGLLEKGTQHIGFGIMRGMNQALAHAQFVSNVVDHEMNIQMAIEAPRFTRRTLAGCGVLIESRVAEKERDELTKRGHQIELRGAYSGQMGGGQAVMYDSASGVKYGASSARKDGAAIPEPDPWFSEPKRLVTEKR